MIYYFITVVLLAALSQGDEALSGSDLKQQLSAINLQRGFTNNKGEIHEEIWKGYNATKGQFPFQALLICKSQNGLQFCGGSLISTSYIITAAHCTYSTIKYLVILGLTDISDDSNSEEHIVYPDTVYTHPEYTPKDHPHDIAIVKLPKPAVLSRYVQTIALPLKAWIPTNTFDNYYVTASGFGYTYNDENNVHPQLQYRTIHKMLQRPCMEFINQHSSLLDDMICTDKNPVYSGPCHGDSGGPLTVKLSTGLYLIGAVSWTSGECDSKNPIVYAYVPYYLQWIHSITGLTTK